jgi:hypothetical protein
MGDGVHHLREVLVQERDERLRRHLLADRREAPDVGEHDGRCQHLAAERDFAREEVLHHRFGHVLAERRPQLVAFVEAVDGLVERRSEAFELVARVDVVDARVVLVLELAKRAAQTANGA